MCSFLQQPSFISCRRRNYVSCISVRVTSTHSFYCQ